MVTRHLRILSITTFVLILSFALAISSACAPSPKKTDDDTENVTAQAGESDTEATEVPQSDLEITPSNDEGAEPEGETVTRENNGEISRTSADGFQHTQEEPLAPPAREAAGTDEAPEGVVSLVVSFDGGDGQQPASDGMTIQFSDKIDVDITIVNKTDETISITFPTSQKLDIIITDSDDAEVYRWSEGVRFAQVISSIELNAGENWSHEMGLYLDKLNMLEFPGTYNIKVLVTGTPAYMNETSDVHLVTN